jgi:hypothetical protein
VSKNTQVGNCREILLSLKDFRFTKRKKNNPMTIPKIYAFDEAFSEASKTHLPSLDPNTLERKNANIPTQGARISEKAV